MTKPFVFKLEAILRFRIQEEEQAQFAFASAKQKYEKQGRLVEELAAQAHDCDERFAHQATMTEADLWLWGNYKKRVHADHKQAAALLVTLAKEVEKKRSTLLQCAQRRKLLEKLKSNQAREHVHNELQQEQKEFDETATLRFKQTYS